MKNYTVRNQIALIVSIFLLTGIAQAAPMSFVYQGQIIKPDLNPLEAASVNFTIQVLSPAPSLCVLFEENHTGVNMSSSNGIFALPVGQGTYVGGEYANLQDSFNNAAAAVTPATCDGPNSYTAAAGDTRMLRVSFDDGGGPVVLNDAAIRSVPFAQYATNAAAVGGVPAANILRDRDDASHDLNQTNLEWIFEQTTRWPELQALINGTSSQYISSSPGATVNLNGQILDNIAAPSDANDATNKNYVDTTIGGQNADALVSAPTITQDGYVLSWNNTNNEYELIDGSAAFGDNLGNHTATANLQMGANYISNDGTASQGLSFDGSNNANFSQNLTVSQGFSVTNGINSGGNISVQSESEFRMEDNAGGEYMGLKAPATVTASTTLTLPDGDGGANQVLGTDGSGNLQWQTDQDNDAVDSVFGRTGAVVAAASDYDADQIDNVAAGNIAATDVQAAINELDTEKLALAGGNMTGALQMDATNEIRFADADSSNYVGFVAPAIVGSDQIWVLPNADGSANQVLATDASGGLFWKNDNDTAAPVDSVFGRTGAVVAAASDYDANQIDNTAAGNIAATDVQAAINELDTEKVAKSGDSMSGNLSLQTESEVRFEDNAGGEYMGLKAPATVTASTTLTLPDGDGGANQVLGTDGSGNLQWQTDQDNDAVDSVFGRTGAVVAAASDYDANQIDNTAAGNIAATDVQAAINELDTEKLALAGGTMTGNLVTGTTANIQMTETAGTGELITLRAPADATAAYTLTLPVDDGAANEVLQTDGSGNLTWVSQTASAPVDSVFGRTGAVTAAASDYDADQIDNVAAGNIAATDVQAAINELDTEKLALAGGTMTGDILMSNEGEVRYADSVGGEYAAIKSPNDLAANYTLTLPADDGAANEVLQTDGSGNLTWVAQTAAAPVDSVFGRTGTVTAAASDYDADQIDNVAAGNIAATDVQAAINELDTEKVAKSGDSMSGNLSLQTESEVRFEDNAGGEYMGLKAPATVTASTTLTLPDGDGGANQVLGTDGSGNLQWQTDQDNDAVDSVFGRTGAVTAAASDYDANQIDNTAAGNIAATDVQAAINELDTEKLALAGGTMTGNLVTGTTANIQMTETAGTGELVTLRAPADATAAYTLTLPVDDGGVGEVLQTDGSGALSWVSLGGGGDFFADGSVPMTGDLDLNAQSDARFRDSDSSHYAAIQAPATITTNYTLTLPADDGAANEVLQTDGSGTLSWVAQPSVPVDSVFGRTGAVTAAASDYDADQIDNTAAGNIAATDVQAAINELDTEKLALAGGTMTGDILMSNEGEVRYADSVGGEYAAIKSPNDLAANYTLTLPADDGAANEVLQTDGSGNLTWVAQTAAAPVDSVFGRTGAVTAAASDYDANQIDNTAAGNIAATDVQAAINELDTEKLALAGGTMTGHLNLDNEREIRFEEATLNGDNYVGFKAPALLGGDIVWELPAADGSANQVLATDASGGLFWKNDNDTAAPVDSVFGRTGAVTAAASDYDADQIDNTAAGNISATDVQSAINELDTEKVAKSGDSMSGNLSLQTESEVRFEDNAGGEYMGLKAPATVTSSVTLTLPDGDGGANQVLGTDGSGNLQWQTDQDTAAPVDSVFGRTGAVTAAASDYDANQIDNTAAGNIAATDVQSAINELDTEKLALAGGTITGNLVTGTTANIQMTETAGTGELVTLRAPADATAAYTLTLPVDDGGSGEVLQTNGSGVLSWVALGGGGDFFANGSVPMTGDLDLNAQVDARFRDSDSSHYAAIQAPATITTNYTLTLPADDGAANEVLQTDGSGVLSWVAQPNVPVDSVFGRTGAVTAAASDYDADQIDNTAAGNIAATDVQAAINELDTEKVAKSGDSMSGNLSLQTESEVRFEDNAGGEYMGLKAPATVTSSVTLTLPDGDGGANQVLGTDGSGNLQWQTDQDTAAPVDSVFGRTGAVTAAASDYDANQIDNTAAGNIAATDVQAAINELDTEKLALAGGTMTGHLNLDNEREIRFEEATGNGDNYVGFKAPALLGGDLVWELPAADGSANQVLATDASGGLFWKNDNDTAAPVDSVFGRTGAVTAAASDYDANQIDNTAAGNIAATDVQAAINELDTEKLALAGGTMTGNLVTGTTANIQMTETAGTGELITLRAPADATAAYTLTLPVDDGGSGEVLQTNGSGVLSWVALGGGGDFFANGSVPMTGDLDLNAQSDARFRDSDSSHYAAIQAPATITTNYTLTLPADDGAANEVLQTDGSGVLSWVAQPSVPVDSVFGRTGAVTAAASDYDADQIDNVAAGNIAATDVQAAINELDTEKLALAGGTMTGDILMSNEGEVRYADSVGGEYAAIKSPNDLAANYTLTLPADDGAANEVLQTDGSGNLTWVAQTAAAPVDSVFGRTGAVTAAASDYDADQIDNTAAGNIAATDVQAAINELDTEKLALAGGTMTGNLVTGTTANIQMTETAGTGELITLRAPADATAAYTLTLPVDDGAANQVLQTDGSGALSWVAQTTAAPVDSVFGRTGAVTAAASDYDADQIDNVAAGDIAATDVQAAINELDTEKLALAGGTMTGHLNLDNEREIRFEEATGNGDNYVGFKAPALLGGDLVWELPAADGSANQVLATDASGGLFWKNDNNTDAVDSVFGRTGAVVATASDYDANQIDNTAAGNIAATDVQAAINELDTEKLAVAGGTMTGDILMSNEGEVRYADSVGGQYAAIKSPNDLAANYTLTLPADDGGAGEVLQTDGSGALSWVALGGGGDFFANGSVPMTGDLDLNAQSDARFRDSDSSHYAAIQAPATITTNYTLTLPADDGTSGQLLSTDGSGVLSWVNAGGVGDFLANGTVAMTGNLQLGSNRISNDGGAGEGLTFDTDGNATFGQNVDLVGSDLSFQGSGTKNIVSEGAAMSIDLDADNNDTGEVFTITKNNGASELLRVNEDGDLGVGTSSVDAGAKLQVEGGAILAGPKGAGASDGGEIRFQELGTNGSNYVGFRAPDLLGGDLVWELPAADGSANQVLATDASGGLFWKNDDSGGAGDFLADGSVPMTGDLDLNAQSDARFRDSDSSHYAAIQAPATITTNYTLTLPADDGTANEVLQTDGSGTLSWVAQPSVPVDSVFGRTGAVTAAASDYDANQIDNVAAGDIAATDVQAAINELDTEKLALAGGTMTGDILMSNEGEVRYADSVGGQYAAIKSPNDLAANYTLTLPADDGAANEVLQTDGSGNLTWVSQTASAPVDSVFGRTGAVTAAASDYDADQIDNTAAGNIAATDVQAAINELDTEKLALAGGTMTGNLVTGTTANIQMTETAGTGELITLRAPADATAAYTLTLPVDDGGANQVLQTDGSGALSWVSQTASAPVDSVFGRTGAVTAAASDYDANQIDNTAAGNIAATDVQAAINELDTEKLALAGGTMTGNLVMNASSDIQLTESGGTGDLITLQSPADATAAYTLTLPVDDGAANQVLQTDGSGALSWVSQTASAPVDSVFGRTGAVTAAASDYDADQIDNTAAGNIAATDVQAAINELDTEKLALAGGTMTGHMNLDNEREIRFEEATGNGDNYVGFKAPALLGGDVVWELPAADGSANQVLATDASGGLFWKTDDSGGAGDFLANGTIPMTGNLRLNGNYLSGDGGNEGVFVHSDGRVAVGTNSPVASTALTVNGSAQATEVALVQTSSVDTVMSYDSNGDFYTTGYDASEGNFVIAEYWDLTSSGTHRLVVEDTTGNIGIGTTDPLTKLDVEGQVTVGPHGTGAGETGQVILEDLAAGGTFSATIKSPDTLASSYALTLPVDDGAANQVLQTDGSGVLSWVAQSSGADDLGDHVMDANLQANGNWISNDGGNEGIRIQNDGDVGIGIASPHENFHVDGTVKIGPAANTDDSGAVFQIQGTGDEYMQLGSDGSGVGGGGGAFSLGVDGNGSGATIGVDLGSIDFRTGVNWQAHPDTAGTSRLFIENGGNVGIGTNNPSYLLDMQYNSASITTGMNLYNASTSASAAATLQFETNAGGYFLGMGTSAAGGDAMVWNEVNSNLLLATNNVERLRITGVGNVGIGTDNPSGKFDVEGGDVFIGSGTLTNASASEDLSVTGNLEVDGILYGNGSGLTGVSASPSADSVDFTEMADSMTLDASTDISVTGTNELSITNTGTGDSFVVNDAASDTTPFIVNSTGSVGIGTNSPAAKFHLHDNSTVSIMETEDNLSAGFNEMRFLSAGTNKWSITHYGDANGQTNRRNDFAIYQYTNQSDTAVNQFRLYLDDSGDIGIGTDNPGTKLDVEGQVTVGPHGTGAGETGQVILEDLAAGGTFSATIKSPDTLASSYVLTLPTDDGTANQVLQTNGSGVLTWATMGGADDLGDHIMDSNLQTNGNYISGDGGNEGLSIDSNGGVTLTTGTGDAGMTITPSAASGNASIGLWGKNSGTTYYSYIASDWSGNISLNAQGGAGAGNINFRDGDSTTILSLTGSDDRATVTGDLRVSGNVGIGGVSSPNAQLEVSGQIVSQVHNNGSGTTFDFDNGNMQYTSASCGAMTLQNMVDGGSYTIAVQGSTSGTCTFTHSGETFKYSPANAATTASTHTTYTFVKMGTTIYVSWITGF